jgi:hypothetical protein
MHYFTMHRTLVRRAKKHSQFAPPQRIHPGRTALTVTTSFSFALRKGMASVLAQPTLSLRHIPCCQIAYRLASMSQRRRRGGAGPYSCSSVDVVGIAGCKVQLPIPFVQQPRSSSFTKGVRIARAPLQRASVLACRHQHSTVSPL